MQQLSLFLALYYTLEWMITRKEYHYTRLNSKWSLVWTIEKSNRFPLFMDSFKVQPIITLTITVMESISCYCRIIVTIWLGPSLLSNASLFSKCYYTFVYIHYILFIKCDVSIARFLDKPSGIQEWVWDMRYEYEYMQRLNDVQIIRTTHFFLSLFLSS